MNVVKSFSSGKKFRAPDPPFPSLSTLKGSKSVTNISSASTSRILAWDDIMHEIRKRPKL